MAIFGAQGIHLASGRAGATSPSVQEHRDTSWACSHPGGGVAAAHLRPVQLHPLFKTKLCTWVPLGRSKSVHEFRRLAYSPHKQPKETCPRLIWPF